MKSLAWLILWLPLFGFAFNAFSGFFIKDRAAQKRAVSYVGPGVVLLAFAVTLYVLFQEVLPAPEHRAFAGLIPWLSPEAPWIKMGNFEINFGLLLDPLSMLMAMIITGVGGLIHIYATGYMAEDREQPRFFTYFNLFIFMMLVLVLGDNFLLMFVGWEGVGSCSYLLISFWYTTTDNAKAGNKAFIVNRVGDLGFALGMMAIWSVFGSLNYFNEAGTGVMQLAAKHQDILGGPLSALPAIGGFTMITFICFMLFVGAMGKSAQIPLWVWLPDAMAGPTPVSALIHAATMVTAGVVMLTRCSWLFVQSAQALQFVGWIGLATAFVGATVGLVQNDIKRVLAFSTVSQLGYMFLACGVGQFWMGMFHVTTHAFFKALLFLGSGAVIHSMHGEQDMRKMGGLKTLIPRTWGLMFIGTIAIAGVPGLSGFFSKDEILHAAQGSPWGNGVILYAVGLATALMTAFYMNRMMWKTFYVERQFENGKLAAHHHSNFEDEEHGHGDAHGHESEPTHSLAEGHGADHEDVHADEADHSHDHGHHEGTGSVHESPPSMMFPLYILAILSVFFGIAVGPTHLFEKFLEPSIAPLSLGGLEEGHHLFDANVGYIVSAIIAFAGLFLARFLYSNRMKTGQLIPVEMKAQWEKNRLAPPAFLYNTFAAKWGFDTAYNWFFIKIGGQFADRILWKTVDKGLIDGLVNGLASLVGGISNLGRKLQTGYVRNYALAMLLGVVSLVAYMIYNWNTMSSMVK